MAGIWADVLKVDRVGINDDFFALGGHSLLATQIVAQARTDFDVDLPLHSIFTAPTVASFAETILNSMRENEAEVAAIAARLESVSDEEAEALLASELSQDEE